jgi:hypothetical protein
MPKKANSSLSIHHKWWSNVDLGEISKEFSSDYEKAKRSSD